MSWATTTGAGSKRAIVGLSTKLVVLRQQLGLPETARLHDLRHYVVFHQHVRSTTPLALQAAYFGHALSGTTLELYVEPHLKQKPETLRRYSRQIANAIDALYQSNSSDP